MDKNFIENCKLLNQHFTQLTQADTTVQSNAKPQNKSTASVIKDAKNLLLCDKIESLTDEDLADLHENSVLKYAKDLEQLESKPKFRKTLCQTEFVKWDDEIFTSSLPHPKNNVDYLNSKIMNDKHFNEELISNKYLNISNNLNKVEIKEIDNVVKDDEKENQRENIEHNKNSVEENENAVNVENIEKITEIPELKIVPQIRKKVEFLEVKKINIENKENTNFDTEEETQIIRNNEILSKSLLEWKNITKQNKIKKNEQSQKIDEFLNNIQKLQKSKSDLIKNNLEKIEMKIKPKSSNLENKITSYQHRFRAQKEIIIMQKQKIEEQTKLIEDLKLNRIQKEARKSLDTATELRKSILNSKHKLKPKTNDKQETDEETNKNSLNLNLSLTKAPRIVQIMEDRAKERQERRLLIQERKRLIEEEKKRQAEEQIQRKMKEEAEEKQRRIEQMKKQREMVRRIEMRKQIEKKRYIELFEMASEHYKKQLKKFIMKHLKMLLYHWKIKDEIAKRFYDNNIVINSFKSWHCLTAEIVNKKNILAQTLYRRKILEKVWNFWKKYQFTTKQCEQVAIDRYEMSLQTKFFIAWHQLVCEYHIQFTINAQKADKFYHRLLLFHYFDNWRNLRAIMEIERIQNERKRKWRLRVAEVLTDYNPLKSYE